MIKQILNVFGLIFGTVGTLLCLAVIVGAWWVNSPITYSLLFRVFPPIESALEFGDVTVGEFNTFVMDTQSRFTEVTDAKPIATALEDEIQQVTLYANIAKNIADSVVQEGNEFADSVQATGNRWLVAQAVGRLSNVLNEATTALDSVAVLAQQIQEGRAENIDALNQQMNRLQEQVVAVDGVIEQTQADVADMKRKVPRWINLASLLVTLLFLWFGAAQYVLLRACWRALRPKQTTRDDVVDALNAQLETLQLRLAEFKSVIHESEQQQS